jgi:hypothetical protein
MFFLIPSNENGVIIDPYAAANIQSVIANGSIQDIFIYSHGWWSSALDAMICYNRFGAGLNGAMSGSPGTLAIGIHWPSMLSENQRDWLNLAEGISFFTMEQRAEHVGRHGVYDLLRLILQQRHAAAQPPDILRIHLLGHSFGCKVICAALAELIDKSPPELCRSANFNLVLLQSAFEDDALAPGQRYGSLASLQNLRMLITKSSQDTALCVHFKRAHALEFFDHEDRTALGATGPNSSTINVFGSATQLALCSPGCTSGVSNTTRLIIADLSEIHRLRAANGSYTPTEFAGQHSDIYFEEIYRLIATFVCTPVHESRQQYLSAPAS